MSTIGERATPSRMERLLWRSRAPKAATSGRAASRTSSGGSSTVPIVLKSHEELATISHGENRLSSIPRRLTMKKCRDQMNRKSSTLTVLTVFSLVLAICSATAAQESATTELPQYIRAGEDLKFTVRLDKAPNFEGGVVQFGVYGPNGANISTSTGPFAPGQTQCSASIHIPAAYRGWPPASFLPFLCCPQSCRIRLPPTPFRRLGAWSSPPV